MRSFWNLALAISKGFWRDRASVFFAIIFPLMFLVLFGGIFGDPTEAKVRLSKATPWSPTTRRPTR
jgi:ABC-2 type transport system permease protein